MIAPVDVETRFVAAPRVALGKMMRAAATTVVLTALSGQASAAGLFLAPQGVRPMSRGGSYVAGADDANALSYNPAGLAEANSSVLFDLSLPLHATRFTRTIEGSAGTLPTVEGDGMGLPIPTLGIAYQFSALPDITFGLGISADVPLVQNWPDTLANGAPAPQRYAIKNYRGTALSTVALGAGWRAGDMLSLGISAQMLVGSFVAQSTLSVCDGFLCVQPERADQDAEVKMISRRVMEAGLQAGLIFIPAPWLRFGLSYETGYDIDSDVELQVRLPSAATFDNAVLTPEKPRGRLQMRLPWQARAGVEARVGNLARLELSVVHEHWSAHQRITVTPGSAVIRNLPAPLGDYRMTTIHIDRHFVDSTSWRLGSEINVPEGFLTMPLTLRAGCMYEPSAIPEQALTAMSVDLNKVMVALGATLALLDGQLFVDATYGYVTMITEQVTGGAVQQTNPTRPAPTGRTAIGDGTYSSRAQLFGLGLRYHL